MKLGIHSFMLITMLTGCAELSQPIPAEEAAPKITRNGIKIIPTTQDFSQTYWWENMHDPLLNQLIREALQYNNQIQSACANVLQAQASLQQARFAWLPTLNGAANGFVGGGWDSQFKPEGPLANSALFSRTGNLHFNGYYTGFIPRYSLNILQNIEQNKLAKASLNLQQATYEATRLSIISQVSGAYFMLIGQREQLQIERQQVQDLNELGRLERVRFKDGASDLSSVTSIEQRIANKKANLPALENSIAANENALQVLLNRNPAPLLTRARLSSLSMTHLIPPHIPAGVLQHRPDILIAWENLKISKANVGLAYANFFPDISLTGLLGEASVDLSHLLNISTNIWLAQGAAALPLLNAPLYAQVKAQKAGYSSAYYHYIQTLRAAFADVDNSLTNQQKMNVAYKLQRQALQNANTSYQLAMTKYKAGGTDYRTVMNARLTLDDAKLNATLAKMQQLDSLVTLYQALAGGYK